MTFFVFIEQKNAGKPTFSRVVAHNVATPGRRCTMACPSYAPPSTTYPLHDADRPRCRYFRMALAADGFLGHIYDLKIGARVTAQLQRCGRPLEFLSLNRGHAACNAQDVIWRCYDVHVRDGLLA